MHAPTVQASPVKATVEIPAMPEMPTYTTGDIAAPEVVAVQESVVAPVRIESGPRPYYSLAAGAN
ncbi:hypothetical protein ABI_28850 [Asticcacaulis biprosthecium C19]|uniref:Uncharacterized protein n=1 Tax=Asticcacaulis biprosthecium C19 TaxID=715226 RepID=F4QMM7_9CAUL|nr:hypothetical protein [Asticcacaulis biprosthecium]EGF91468.1 hypothetical protein ABI_28850 [Asticcacaulis biprosthecium C19]